jgi:hypothetical protein
MEDYLLYEAIGGIEGIDANWEQEGQAAQERFIAMNFDESGRAFD